MPMGSPVQTNTLTPATAMRSQNQGFFGFQKSRTNVSKAHGHIAKYAHTMAESTNPTWGRPRPSTMTHGLEWRKSGQ